MKKLSVIYVIVLLGTVRLSAQSVASNSIDYINSKYYTKVAEAQYSYLKDDKREAYNILTEIEQTIPLLDIPGIYEMEMFVELSLLYKNYTKAYQYINKLISDYGYKIKDFMDFKNFRLLKRKDFYEAKALIQAENEFIPDTIISVQLQRMHDNDQYYRTLPAKDCNVGIEELQYINNSNKYWVQYDSIDRINYAELTEIIRKDGYPLSKTKKYDRVQRGLVYTNLSTMTMHISDSANIEEMKAILLENIRMGDCYPDLFACLVDRNCLSKGKCYIYGMYDNISSNQICDIQNLDKRRSEIGLPSYKLGCEIQKLILRKMAIRRDMPKIMYEILEKDCDF
ncbi:MAG: hypothetical protein LBQ31_05495 [Bacteroidales bacterium]|jgi:hypothetical protein|nr:hypothetical protein [Bacteroidales bacterium]